MSPAIGSVLDGAIVLAGISLCHAVLVEAGAARDRRRHEVPCPFGDDPDERPPLASAVVRVVLEGVCIFAQLATVPLALLPRPARRMEVGDRPPVLFVHGWAGTPAAFLLLRRRLAGDGWLHLHHVWLPPVFATPERGAERVARAIARVRSRTGASMVDVLAHSLGGIVVRVVLETTAAPGIGRVITLGTPHQGTRAVVGAFDPMLRTLVPGSSFLRHLGADGAPPGTECVSIYSTDDAVIRPPENGYWPGVLNVEVRGPGHNGLLASRRVYELVRELLEADPAQASAPVGASHAS